MRGKAVRPSSRHWGVAGGGTRGRTQAHERPRTTTEPADARLVGLDVGTETLKLVELQPREDGLACTRRLLVEHEQRPLERLRALLEELDWTTVTAAAVGGRFSRQLRLPRIPDKEALAQGLRFVHGDAPATLVTIGSRGFSVLERSRPGRELYRTNSRCSQGTGNFLRQLVQRFGLTVEAASQLADAVDQPAALSGRCPVILKTDMTHLANAGEDRARILAGLFDAVCENVQTLLRPGSSPPQVIVSGGVSRSQRVQRHFRRFLETHRMELLTGYDEQDVLLLPALGCALAAWANPEPIPSLDSLFQAGAARPLEEIPPLSASADHVTHLAAHPAPTEPQAVYVGLDIGSTGAKIVALDAASDRAVWQSYAETAGDPVGAAQLLIHRFLGELPGTPTVTGFGVTGSGRQIVGSLLETCFGDDAVYVVNEIVAHAMGALSFDESVDTIFEIGGQDAKYIRLEGGRIVDAAMNEACSAGTGSFLAELGRRLLPDASVTELGERASRAPRGIGLGQHCSVFMAEVVDEALAMNVEKDAILAGLYDSVIQNYLNRVKGARGIGQVVFCQGMPFASPALAAAVARRTGSRVIVPPSPGMVGALGIALLAKRERPPREDRALEPGRALDARVTRRDAFVCRSTRGCGGSGNRCRIDRMTTVVDGMSRSFTWGGACSLHDRGAARHKLPEEAPNPFREREELAQSYVAMAKPRHDGPRIGLTDEFVLKGCLPFFVTWLSELGMRPVLPDRVDREALKRGIARSNTSWCAPMQLFHGVISSLDEAGVDRLFLPMVRSLPRSAAISHSATCPICQASPDLLRWDLGIEDRRRVLSPVFDLGAERWRSRSFREACLIQARELGVRGREAELAYDIAVAAQEDFEEHCQRLGQAALEFCRDRDLTAVVVLGRPYTIYNPLLNSNVPAILREQGALPVPLECFPIDREVPAFGDMYWGYGQHMLRGAHQVRRTPGVYAVHCSNYSCGPDSFNLHLLADAMAGKPFTVIETDGHSGDAGTRTRVEAFLHCARAHRAAEQAAGETAPILDVSRHQGAQTELGRIREREERLLVPWASRANAVIAASLRGEGIDAEALPYPGSNELEIGRRHTSGKECLPLALTLGAALSRIDQEVSVAPERRISVLMPSTRGPCRFGCYTTIFKMVMERLGLDRRVSIWSPRDSDYFRECGPATAAITLTGIAARDLLEATVRQHPPGTAPRQRAETLAGRYEEELLELVEREVARQSPMSQVFKEVFGGGLFGCRQLLRRAADELAALGKAPPRPKVLVAGEVYVRLDPFANGFLVEELERRGLEVMLAPLSEWFEYASTASLDRGDKSGWRAQLSHHMQLLILQHCHRLLAAPLELDVRVPITEVIEAASPYLKSGLYGEAVLTVGGPSHEWSAGKIDGTVNVGPMECMPSRIAASQLQHITEREGLPVLNLSMSGEPLDTDQLDDFAFDVRRAFEARRDPAATAASHRASAARQPAAAPAGEDTTTLDPSAQEGWVPPGPGDPRGWS